MEADILEHTGTASVNQRGIGITILNGTNTYTGETRISNGTLSVQEGGSISQGTANLYVGDTASQAAPWRSGRAVR